MYEGVALDIDALEIQENADLLGITTRESRMREPGTRAIRCAQRCQSRDLTRISSETNRPERARGGEHPEGRGACDDLDMTGGYGETLWTSERLGTGRGA
mmetsp:Transcript_98296/g.315928  ORF Transcript_98296/g.315928 Transcript_98296/m.315928 type:complete len:100 (+) Transcript_98296:867-1166(+)